MSTATMERIRTLAATREHKLATAQYDGTRPLTETQQASIIRYLEGRPVKGAAPVEPRKPLFDHTLPPLRHFSYLRPGLYATITAPGDDPDKIDFWRVRRETDESSKWHGWNFIDRVTGGVGDLKYYPLKGEDARRALLAIEQHGPEDSEILAATKLQRCRRCHSPLTNDLSRERLYGTWCWDRKDDD